MGLCIKSKRSEKKVGIVHQIVRSIQFVIIRIISIDLTIWCMCLGRG